MISHGAKGVQYYNGMAKVVSRKNQQWNRYGINRFYNGRKGKQGIYNPFLSKGAGKTHTLFNRTVYLFS